MMRQKQTPDRNTRAANLAAYRAGIARLMSRGFAFVRTRGKDPVNGWNLIDSADEIKPGERAAAVHSQSGYICIDVDFGLSYFALLLDYLSQLGIAFALERTPREGLHIWIDYLNPLRPGATPYNWRGIKGEVRRGNSYTVVYNPGAILADMDRADSQSPPRDAVEKVIAMLCPLASPRPRRDPSAHNADWKNPAVSNPGLHWNRLAYTEVLLGRQQTWHNLHGDALKAAHSGVAVAEHDLKVAHDCAQACPCASYSPTDSICQPL